MNCTKKNIKNLQAIREAAQAILFNVTLLFDVYTFTEEAKQEGKQEDDVALPDILSRPTFLSPLPLASQ